MHLMFQQENLMFGKYYIRGKSQIERDKSTHFLQLSPQPSFISIFKNIVPIIKAIFYRFLTLECCEQGAILLRLSLYRAHAVRAMLMENGGSPL